MAEQKQEPPKPKKPGVFSRLAQAIGEAIGQAKFGQ